IEVLDIKLGSRLRTHNHAVLKERPLITLLVNLSLEIFPLRNELAGLLGTIVMGIVSAMSRSPTCTWNLDTSLLLVNLGAPHARRARIQGIECVQASENLRTAQVYRKSQLDAPRTKHVGDTRQLPDKVAVQNTRIRIHIVYRAPVDSDRGQQTSVLSGTSQV